MQVTLRKSIEQNGWVSIWMVDECGRHLHTEPVCTIPVGYGHAWFAEYLDGKILDAPTWPLNPPCEELLSRETKEIGS